jgi:16S rRNA (cytidine1402-2'-O)-methyltransferase
VPGKLTVAPTPIGNMEDVTPRVRRALAEADVVACEDTRRAGRLFERLEIPTPRLVSNHEGNEDERALQLAQAIERGAKVALVTDAGTPAISDPGWRLIRTCIDRDLDIEVLPGPSAVVTALVASGLPAHRWRFEGFLPRRAGELERVLQASETVIAFESPRRLPDSLAALAQLAPDRPAAVCRELSKLHEEVARGTLSELARRFRADVRGEIVLVLGAGAGTGAGGAEGEDMHFAVDALRRLVQSGARPRAAAQVVAALTGARPNELYTALTGRAPRE